MVCVCVCDGRIVSPATRIATMPTIRFVRGCVDVYRDVECTIRVWDGECISTRQHPVLYVKFSVWDDIHSLVNDYLLDHGLTRADLDRATHIHYPDMWDDERRCHRWERELSITFADKPVRHGNTYTEPCLTYEVYTDPTDDEHYHDSESYWDAGPVRPTRAGNGEYERYWCGIPFTGENYNFCVMAAARKVHEDNPRHWLWRCDGEEA